MKIAEILNETLATRKIPFEITHTYEWDDPSRDEDLDPTTELTIYGYVIVTPRMYSDRDSPTGYEVIFQNAVDDEGHPFNLDRLSDFETERIRQQAIDEIS